MKSRKFSDWRYVGDPLNTAKIFNDKDTDELIVLDVDATKQGREPEYEILREIAAECFLPICYGGGVASPETAKKVTNCGIDKVAINTAILEKPGILRQTSDVIGSSSTVASLDVINTNGNYELLGKPGVRIWELAAQLESLGAGEILIQSVDKDGTKSGPDLDLAAKMLKSTELPIVYAGGVSSLKDSAALWKLGIGGVAAGSWFVFRGKRDAVLVTYPLRRMVDESLGFL
jgi:cyclase